MPILGIALKRVDKQKILPSQCQLDVIEAAKTLEQQQPSLEG